MRNQPRCDVMTEYIIGDGSEFHQIQNTLSLGEVTSCDFS